MRTIFIPIFQGVEALHILRTDIFATLAARQDIRIVLFVPSTEKRDYYQKEFPASERLVYVVTSGYRDGWLDALLGRAKVYLLRTATMDIKRQLRRGEGGSAWRYYVSLVGNRVLARPLMRRIARWCDVALVKNAFFAEAFDTYKPDLVFLAHLFADVEIAMLREAKRRGVTSVGFINSWDKLTSRCILRILPDRLVVPNELTKREAMRYHDAPEASLYVSGPPQFDIYAKLHPTPRETFCRDLGIDPSRRLILFCPVGKAFSDTDWSVIELLDRAIGDGRHPKSTSESLTRSAPNGFGALPANLHVLVRFPPNDTVEMRDTVQPGRFSFIQPGVRFSRTRGVDWDMGPADQQSLVDDIYHSALVICSFSTMTIDAAILDKPVINLDFDSGPAHRMYERTHYLPILASGGVRLVRSEEELLTAISEYLAHPESDAPGRARIRGEQVGKLDGGAGARVARFIENLVS